MPVSLVPCVSGLSDKMASLGYNQSDIVRAVEENECNEMMATYLLLQQQYVVGTLLSYISTLLETLHIRASSSATAESSRNACSIAILMRVSLCEPEF